MVASLPAMTTFAVAHTITPTEWAQILNCTKGLSNIQTANFPGTLSVSTASATYVNITGFTMSGFSKYLNSSDLFVVMACSSRCTTTANHSVNYGINVNATDTQMMAAWHTTVAKHNPSIGFGRITGVPSGAGYTFTGRIKADGTNTVAIDGNDTGFLIVMEVPN